MTKQVTNSSIIAQRVDHILYFAQDRLVSEDTPDGKYERTEANTYLLRSIAGDYCYTAHNSVEFKKKQLSEALGRYDEQVENKNDAAAERAGNFAQRLYEELEILEERLTIEKAVFKDVTEGEDWHPQAKKPLKVHARSDIALMRKAVGR